MTNRYQEVQRRASTRAQAKAIAVDARKFKQKRALSWAVVVATAAILLLMLASFARAATVKSKRGYSIAAPAGWKVVQSGEMGTDLILMAPKANNFQPNVNVIVQPLPPGMNLKRG